MAAARRGAWRTSARSSIAGAWRAAVRSTSGAAAGFIAEELAVGRIRRDGHRSVASRHRGGPRPCGAERSRHRIRGRRRRGASVRGCRVRPRVLLRRARARGRPRPGHRRDGAGAASRRALPLRHDQPHEAQQAARHQGDAGVADDPHHGHGDPRVVDVHPARATRGEPRPARHGCRRGGGAGAAGGRVHDPRRPARCPPRSHQLRRAEPQARLRSRDVAGTVVHGVRRPPP